MTAVAELVEPSYSTCAYREQPVAWSTWIVTPLGTACDLAR